MKIATANLLKQFAATAVAPAARALSRVTLLCENAEYNVKLIGEGVR